jgi:hypothetical protein
MTKSNVWNKDNVRTDRRPREGCGGKTPQIEPVAPVMSNAQSARTSKDDQTLIGTVDRI